MLNLINIIKQKNKLLPVSAGITVVIMLLFFVIAQVLSFTSLAEETAEDEEMEVREVMKLKFPEPEITRIIPHVRVNPQQQVFPGWGKTCT